MQILNMSYLEENSEVELLMKIRQMVYQVLNNIFLNNFKNKQKNRFETEQLNQFYSLSSERDYCENSSCSVCGHYLQDPTHLLDCPASEPLRRAIFGSTSSVFDLGPDLVVRLDCWISVEFLRAPHPSEGSGAPPPPAWLCKEVFWRTCQMLFYQKRHFWRI